MRENLRPSLIPVFILLALALITSCTREKEERQYSYFVSKELVISYNKKYIGGILNTAASYYPEVSDLKEYVTSDVDVYKVVYKTTVGGREINASGLVCVPSTANSYPVLCFQNGTNTKNDRAPSEFASNTGYQMIEFIASMGFIVVMPDYPGFGESVQIPHPYLITEPTVRSSIDMLFAVRELRNNELPGISQTGDYYLTGYSQGGWATLALHKAMETDFAGEFNLVGSACGAGPYDLEILLEGMTEEETYPMPVYIAYIVNAYSAYEQFSNPVTDILNEPYASKLPSLFTGNLDSDQINSELTTSIADLVSAGFLTGYSTDSKYSGVRAAFSRNSITGWKTEKPLYLLHGGNDTHVIPVVTENLYEEMMQAGTSPLICSKEIIPGVDHAEGAVPCMVKGLFFILGLKGD